MDELIDRSEERIIIEDALRSIDEKSILPKYIFEFYGLSGIGKTWLLDYNRNQAAKYMIASTRVDLNTMVESAWGSRLRIMDSIINQLMVFGGPFPSDYRAAVHEISTHPDTRLLADHEIKPAAEAFIAYFDAWLRDKKGAMLIFDDADQYGKEIMPWLVKSILKPLVKGHYPNLIIILAGRKSLEDLGPEIIKVKREPASRIKPFTPEFTRMQIMGGSSPYVNLADTLHELTQGLPQCTDFVLKHLKENHPEIILSQGLDKQELLNFIGDEIIPTYISRQAEEYERPLILLLSYARRFELNLLKELIEKFSLEFELEYNTSRQAINVLLFRLTNNTSLVSLAPEEGGYVLDKLLAKLIQTNERFTAPKRYTEIHKFLMNWHLNLLPNGGGSDVRDVGDAIYYMVQSYSGLIQAGEISEKEARDNIEAFFQTELQKRYARSNSNKFDYTSELGDRLRKDTEMDAVLPGICAGLRSRLSDFIIANQPVPYSVLSIKINNSVNVSLNSLHDAVVREGHLNNFAQAANIHVSELLGDLDSLDSTACKRMFNLSLPAHIQDRIKEIDTPIRIETNYADQAWELMHDGQDFLCLRVPVGRLPVMHKEVRKNKHLSSCRPRVLLIGDANEDLPQARQEVLEIRDMLADRAEVVTLIGKEATLTAFTDHLVVDTPVFDIIHFAGHAYSNLENPQEPKLALSFSDEKVEPDIIQGSLKYSPIVFLNACAAGFAQSGQLPGGYLGSYTSGMITAFLIGGARACIAPLWPVPDGAARNFAIKFYQRILEGDRLGESIRQARLYSRDIEKQMKVWAAYVLYGDPTLKIV